MAPVVFATLASVSMGLWVVFNKVAAGYVNQLLGAILLSVTAVAIGGTVFLLRGPQAARLVTNPKGIIFVALAGAAAFSMDFLGLTAYSRGLPITVGGPIIIGGSIAVATLLGFSLGEPVSLTKVIAIVLIVGGAALLARLA